jgi:hypothetical protein
LRDTLDVNKKEKEKEKEKDLKDLHVSTQNIEAVIDGQKTM